MTQPQPKPRRAAPPNGTMVEEPVVAISSEIAQAIDEVRAQAQAPQAPPIPSSVDEAVVRVEVEHDYGKGGPGTFTTLSGVVLKIKPFPVELSQRIHRNMLPNMPQPPRRYIESDDKWLVDNDDPDYKRAIAGFLAHSSDITFYTRMTLGTEILSLPTDGSVIPLDDDRWIDLIANPDLYGEYAPVVHHEGLARYVDWLQFYVLGEGDVRHLYDVLEYASGAVKERKVVEAMESFRNHR